MRPIRLGESTFDYLNKVKAEKERRASLADVKPSHPLAAFTSEELRAELDRREAEMAVA